MPPLIIHGMYGLGDNIYQRAFLHDLCAQRSVFLHTAWPELYSDIPNLSFCNTTTQLRTQAKNLQKTQIPLVNAPVHGERLHIRYGANLEGSSIPELFQKLFKTTPHWDLPPLPLPLPKPNINKKPTLIVRPCTVRKEWANPARNPKWEYLCELCDRAKESYHIIAVADLCEGQEWLVGDLPFCHEAYLKGELSVMQLLSLVKGASLVVGGIGWLLPASICAQTPALFVLGGQGKHNHPKRLTSPSMNLTHIYFAIPDEYCICSDMKHACEKTITNFRGIYEPVLTKYAK